MANPTANPTANPISTPTLPPACTFRVRVRTALNDGAPTSAAARIRFEVQTPTSTGGRWAAWEDFHDSSASTGQWDTASYTTPAIPLRLKLSLAETTDDNWEIDRVLVQGRTVFSGNRVIRTQQGITGSPNVLEITLDQTTRDLVLCLSPAVVSAPPSSSPSTVAPSSEPTRGPTERLTSVPANSATPHLALSTDPTRALTDPLTLVPANTATPRPVEIESSNPNNSASSADSSWSILIAFAMVVLALALVYGVAWKRRKARELRQPATRDMPVRNIAFLPGASGTSLDGQPVMQSGGPLGAAADEPLPATNYANADDVSYADVDSLNQAKAAPPAPPTRASGDPMAPLAPRRNTAWHMPPTGPATPREPPEYTACSQPEISTAVALGPTSSAMLTGDHVYEYQDCGGDSKAGSTLAKPTQEQVSQVGNYYADVDYLAQGQSEPDYVDPNLSPPNGAMLAGEDHVYEYQDCGGDAKVGSTLPTPKEQQGEPDYADPVPIRSCDYVDPNPSPSSGPMLAGGGHMYEYQDCGDAQDGQPEPDYVDPITASWATRAGGGGEDHPYEYQDFSSALNAGPGRTGDRARLDAIVLQAYVPGMTLEHLYISVESLKGDPDGSVVAKLTRPLIRTWFLANENGKNTAWKPKRTLPNPKQARPQATADYADVADLNLATLLQTEPEYADCGDGVATAATDTPDYLEPQCGQGPDSPEYAVPPQYRPRTVWGTARESNHGEQQYSTVLNSVATGVGVGASVVGYDSAQPAAPEGQGQVEKRTDAAGAGMSHMEGQYGFVFVAAAAVGAGPSAAEPQYATAPPTIHDSSLREATGGDANITGYMLVKDQQRAAETGGPDLYEVVDRDSHDGHEETPEHTRKGPGPVDGASRPTVLADTGARDGR